MTDSRRRSLSRARAGCRGAGINWRVKLAIAVLIAFAIGVVLFTNNWLTDRFTETTRSRAELRLALYSGNILTELQRNSVVPLLLARDPELIGALDVGNFALHLAAPDLVPVRDRGGLDPAAGRGRAGGGGDQPQPDLGTNYRTRAVLRRGAAVEGHGLFRGRRGRTGGYGFTYSRALVVGEPGGRRDRRVVDMMKYERAWAGLAGCGAGDRQRGHGDAGDRAALARAAAGRGAGAAVDAPSAIERALARRRPTGRRTRPTPMCRARR